MDYEISISDDKSFVKVYVKRPIPLDAALTLTKKSADLSGKHGINSLLIDVHNIEDTWGILGDYQFAQDLDKYGGRHKDRVALLVKVSDKTHDFLETTTRNLGYNLRIFTNYEDAVMWLKA
jgi:hypothetical protein